ncbi:hypothetical protein [Candidatus Magnetaquicoccus inordinatus]|uniref:hypothetical protein n=1 Tax=Candidatus Magnetaquicoccus inordinatus TaxID=2496818 RepID=UPI00102CAA46|nr:hypothetical protein [Candidatus Magnetaquicoccus inordinatus]
MSYHDDPWLELLQHLRRQTGITPTPLSPAEKESGILSLFSSPESTPTPAKGMSLAEQGISLQALLNYLREQTGITPIPLSADERRSGIVHAFAGGSKKAPAEPPATARSSTASSPAADPTAELRERLQRLRKEQQPTLPVAPTTAPSAPAANTPKSLSRHLAAYQKGKKGW